MSVIKSISVETKMYVDESDIYSEVPYQILSIELEDKNTVFFALEQKPDIGNSGTRQCIRVFIDGILRFTEDSNGLLQQFVGQRLLKHGYSKYQADNISNDKSINTIGMTFQTDQREFRVCFWLYSIRSNPHNCIARFKDVKDSVDV